jgi:hypothetical protein
VSNRVNPPTELVESFAEGDVLIVAGAGVSRALSDGKSPSWPELVQQGAHEVIGRDLRVSPDWLELTLALIATGAVDDLIQAAGRVQRALTGANLFSGWLRRSLGSLEPRTDHELVTALARLNVPILTTNYDTLLERALGRDTATWRSPPLVQLALRGDVRPVVHLHGVWTDSETVVFSGESYQALIDSEAAQALQSAMAIAKTLVFIGSGGTTSDPNIGRLLTWLEATLRSSEKAHFELTATGDERVRPSCLRAVEYGDDHGLLAGFLQAVADAATVNRGWAATPASAAPLRPTTPTVPRAQALSNVPRRPYTRLVGRDDDLRMLLDLVLEPGPPIVIEGGVGTGKTALAIELANVAITEQSGVFDAVIWLSMQEPFLEFAASRGTRSHDFDEALTSIASVIDAPEILRLEELPRAAAVLGALSRLRTLVVFDNFDSVRDARMVDLLHRLPESCAAIITTQTKTGFGRRLHVRPLGDHEMRMLLDDALAEKALSVDDRVAASLLERSGGLPLALSILVGQLAALPPHAISAGLSAEGEARIFDLFRETVAAIVESAERLVLVVAASLPLGVPAPVLIATLKRLGHAPEHIDRALVATTTSNLTEYDEEHQRYSTLPVLDRFLIHGQPFGSETWADEVRAAHRALVTAFEPHVEQVADQLWRKASTLTEWEGERRNVFTAVRLAVENGDDHVAANLLVSFYLFAMTFGHFPEYLEWTDVVLSRDPQLDPLLAGDLIAKRASVLAHAGRAAEAKVEVVRAQQVLDGLALPGDLQNMLYFVRAIVAVALREPDAEVILRDAIRFEEAREAAGGSKWQRLGFQGWLVRLLVELGDPSRFAQARELCEAALVDAQEQEDRRSEVFLLVVLASLRTAMDDARLNVDDGPEMIKLADKYGEEHNRASMYFEVGRSYLSEGDVERGKVALEEAGRLFRRLGRNDEAARCEKLLLGGS